MFNKEVEGKQAVLVGTYRAALMKRWILAKGYYNYPLAEGEKVTPEQCQWIKELWLYKGKTERKVFSAEFLGVKSREELPEYPASKTKPHGDKYLLFKVSELYGPQLENAKVLVRVSDFAKRTPKIAAAIKAFQEGGEASTDSTKRVKALGAAGVLAEVLPAEVVAVKERLCVHEEALLFDYYNYQFPTTIIPPAPHAECCERGTKHILINGDSRNMTKIATNSVELIVTSPPYWQLKDYGSANQIGFHDSYESYINNLNLVWKECDRILKPGCRLCINIGDQFARSVYYGRYKVIPIRTEIIRFCETIGLDYMGAVIWQKQTTMNTTGGGAIMGSFPYPRNGILKIDYEFILIFKKQGKAPVPDIESKRCSEMTKEEWNKYFSSHWTFGGARQDGHIAMFPEELPARLIKMFTFVGETVFDPFMGSGTTALAAKHLGRNSIGYEINREFKQFYEGKVCDERLFDSAKYEFDVDTDSYCQLVSLQDLPYRFVDPLKLDKKIDVKKLQFGSKIDAHSGTREEYFYVVDVISPTIVKLSNGIEVRLIGVEVVAEKADAAMLFLREKTLRQKVFVKYDQMKYDDDGRLMGYLYLENKTFINAHLLKRNLVDVDLRHDFHHKTRFVNYKNGVMHETQGQ